MHALGIDDAYHVERTLAEGRAGVTQLVTIEGSGPFVRKKIPSSLANRAVWAALADCESPRLPQVAATYEMPDCFVAVYDYVPGNTLEHVMASRGRLTRDEAVQIAQDVCEAVSSLHAHGIVHCDINPSNVVVAADGAHLIDFGIAHMTGQKSTCDTVALGTWGFAAPEQYGFAPVDARSDVYSLARMLGYMLTGVSPDLADDAFVRALADSTVVSRPLADAIRRGSAFEPSARYQSIAGFSQALVTACAKPNGPRMPDDERGASDVSFSASWNGSEADFVYARPYTGGRAVSNGESSSSGNSGYADRVQGVSDFLSKARIMAALYREVRDSRFLQCAILLALGLVMSIVGNFLGAASGDSDSPFYMMAVMGMLLIAISLFIFVIGKVSK